MTTIYKSVIKSFRATAKRVFGRGRNDSIWLSVTATPEELVLRSVWNDAVLEYRVRDQFEPATFAVQLEHLGACEAKSSEPVNFEPSAEGVTVQWLDRGIPQQVFCPNPTKELPAFPEKPPQFWTTDAGLLRALGDATDTTDSESSRYALGCVCLRGDSGSIAATDGRQLLVQRGCEFPWSGDLLIPARCSAPVNWPPMDRLRLAQPISTSLSAPVRGPYGSQSTRMAAFPRSTITFGRIQWRRVSSTSPQQTWSSCCRDSIACRRIATATVRSPWTSTGMSRFGPGRRTNPGRWNCSCRTAPLAASRRASA